MGNCGNSREMAPRRRHVASNQCWRGERLKSRELRPVPPPPCLPAALRSRGKSRESGAGQGAAAQPWRPSGAGGGGGGGAAGAEGGGGGGGSRPAGPGLALARRHEPGRRGHRRERRAGGQGAAHQAAVPVRRGASAGRG